MNEYYGRQIDYAEESMKLHDKDEGIEFWSKSSIDLLFIWCRLHVLRVNDGHLSVIGFELFESWAVWTSSRPHLAAALRTKSNNTLFELGVPDASHQLRYAWEVWNGVAATALKSALTNLVHLSLNSGGTFAVDASHGLISADSAGFLTTGGFGATTATTGSLMTLSRISSRSMILWLDWFSEICLKVMLF